ncbi:MAG: hypothetical protein ABH951_02820 [Patescibacteria group bacterium]
MENFTFKKENNKNTEFKKLFEQISKKINLASKILLLSAAISFGALKSQAQEKQNEQKDFGAGKLSIEWETKTPIPEKEKEQTEKTIEEQRNWLINYTQSKKFKERLTKEYLRTNELVGSDPNNKLNYNDVLNYNNELNYKKFKKNPKFITFEINEEGDTISQTNHLTNKGFVTFSNPKDTELYKKENALEKFLPDPDTSKMTEEDKNIIKFIIDMRLGRLNYGEISVVDSIELEDAINILGNFSPTTKNIKFKKDFKKTDEATPIHELTHKTTNAEKNIQIGTIFLLRSRVSSSDPYLNEPTEIHARINELRFLLDKEKIYDASNENFTEKDYKKMEKNKRIMKNPRIEDLFDTLPKEDLIWFMNNIAGIPISTTEYNDLA